MRPLHCRRRVIIGVLYTGLIILAAVINIQYRWIAPTFNDQIIALAFIAVGILMGVGLHLRGLKKTVYILIPYLITVVALETGVRVYRGDPTETSESLPSTENLGLESVYVPHHYMLYNLRPHLKTSAGTFHNRLGLRDHREAYGDKHIIRIVFMGGSSTYTINIKDNRKIFTYGLEQRLNQYYQDQLEGYTIEVVNAGMGGATSAENLLRLIFIVSEIKPDLVVIQHGINDVHTRVIGAIQSDFGNYRKSWSRPNTDLVVPGQPVLTVLTLAMVRKSALATFILQRLGHPLPYPPEPHPYHIYQLTNRFPVGDRWKLLAQNDVRFFRRNTRFMIAISRSMGAQVLLATAPHRSVLGKAWDIAMPQQNALLKTIAKQENVWFYDFARDMPKDAAHLPDGCHVSQMGSDMKRDLFLRYFIANDIIPRLKKRKNE